ncbi:hypothetical protein FNU79_15900 [Deinococcus detaillensis]|uniref:Uncharacterized protein n=1 Tax=Deinococcus detaillensis TaxID=2592048 RepID=A0A553UKT5_9DEIO|nr:hypothetical protein [Deinococcus detaillensis]TSA80817.1 hypothetical protein FNU79_15900 [Deinococcus detaillensis]
MDAKKTLPEMEREHSKSIIDAGDKLFYNSYRDIYGFLSDLLREMPDMSLDEADAKSVICRQIFMRLMQDYRSSHLLIMAGYPYSAGSIVASMLELAYEIGWLIDDQDNSRLDKWSSHQDLRSTSENYFNRMQSIITSTYPNDKDERLEIERETYKNLSAMKHGNSVILREAHSFINEENLCLTPIPILTGSSLNTSKYVAFQASRIALVAGAFFADGFLGVEALSRLAIRFTQLEQDYREAHRAVNDTTVQN